MFLIYRNVLFLVILIYAAAMDIKYRVIPNRIIFLGVLLWLAEFLLSSIAGSTVTSIVASAISFSALWNIFLYGLLRISASIIRQIIIALIPATGMYMVSHMVNKILKTGEMGRGDSKLVFVIVLYLGFWRSIYMLFIACVLGILLFMWKCLIQRKIAETISVVSITTFVSIRARYFDARNRDQTIPFGPCLAASTSLFMFLRQMGY